MIYILEKQFSQEMCQTGYQIFFVRSKIMNFTKNVSARKIIIFGFALIGLIIILSGTVNFKSQKNLAKEIQKIRQEVFPQAMKFMNLKFHVVQIQQWLTDISATRAAEGFDDGFAEAAGHYKSAGKIINELVADFKDKPDMLKNLQNFKKALGDYYRVGKEMANAYIKGGPDSGNIYMGKFDPYAAKLTDMTDKFVKTQTGKMSDELDRIENDALSSLYLSNVLFISILCVLIVLGIFILKFVISPLITFLDKFSLGSSGDLTVRSDMDGKNEIGQLSKSFNSFMERLGELMNSVKESTKIIREDSININHSSGELNNTFDMQSGSISSVASATEELNASAAEVTDTVREGSVRGEEVQQLAGSGRDKLNSSVQDIVSIKDKVERLNSAVRELANSSNHIADVLNVINDISDQTNLLALNAAIEAARAGEHGRGFAVVADEVRKLAERTQDSVKEIENIIIKLNNESTNAMKDMALANEQVDAGVENIISIEKDIEQVVVSITGLAESNSMIAVAIEEQVSTISGINRDTQDIAAGLEESSAAVNQVSSTTDNFVLKVQELEEKINFFKT